MGEGLRVRPRGLQAKSHDGGQREQWLIRIWVEDFGGSPSRGALEGLPGLGRGEGGPRFQHGMAVSEAVSIYRHHKTPRAGA